MLELDNLTGFHGQTFESMDNTDRTYDVIIAKISYDFYIDKNNGQSELKFASIQSPVIADDLHFGDEMTSVRYETDLVPYKPKLDFIINAIAYAPMDKSSNYFPVSASIGGTQKVLTITGPRNWEKKAIGWVLSEPSAISKLPIRYEYAFGGSHTIGEQVFSSSLNPYGMGFYPQEYLNQANLSNSLPAFQIYSPHQTIEHINQNIRAEGFGFYGKYFEDRIKLIGDTGKDWQEQRNPLLPRDFNLLYWNGAHPEMQFKHPKFNQVYDITLTGMVPAHEIHKQIIQINLPVETLFIYFKTTNQHAFCKDLQLDTIYIDVENRQIDCTYRIALPLDLGVQHGELRYIAIDQRKQQIELVEELTNQENPTDFFSPIPPSLLIKN